MRKSPPENAPGSVVTDEDARLFRDAVRDASPLAPPGRAPLHTARPAPAPRPRPADAPVPVDDLSDHVPLTETLDGDLPYCRPGISRATLRKMKNGSIPVEGEIDLHGLTTDRARAALTGFLATCDQDGRRCVRIIHGKGLRSPNQEPVLKQKVRSWLMQRSDVLAFCPARAGEGGSGAVIVLLRRASARPLA